MYHYQALRASACFAVRCLRPAPPVRAPNPEVREALGWATLPEAGHSATVQPFTSAVDAHTGLVWFEDTDFFFAFGPGTQVTAFPRVGEPLW